MIRDEILSCKNIPQPFSVGNYQSKTCNDLPVKMDYDDLSDVDIDIDEIMDSDNDSIDDKPIEVVDTDSIDEEIVEINDSIDEEIIEINDSIDEEIIEIKDNDNDKDSIDEEIVKIKDNDNDNDSIDEKIVEINDSIDEEIVEINDSIDEEIIEIDNGGIYEKIIKIDNADIDEEIIEIDNNSKETIEIKDNDSEETIEEISTYLEMINSQISQVNKFSLVRNMYAKNAIEIGKLMIELQEGNICDDDPQLQLNELQKMNILIDEAFHNAWKMVHDKESKMHKKIGINKYLEIDRYVDKYTDIINGKIELLNNIGVIIDSAVIEIQSKVDMINDVKQKGNIDIETLKLIHKTLDEIFKKWMSIASKSFENDIFSKYDMALRNEILEVNQILRSEILGVNRINQINLILRNKTLEVTQILRKEILEVNQINRINQTNQINPILNQILKKILNQIMYVILKNIGRF